MRVMVLVKATADSERGAPPSKELLAEMGRFNEQLVAAGVMVDGAGLRRSAAGRRVRFAGRERTVIDGPFVETKELVAGYWIWEVRSVDEAVDWLKRCPHPHPGKVTEVEIRPLMTAADFEQPAG